LIASWIVPNDSNVMLSTAPILLIAAIQLLIANPSNAVIAAVKV